MSTHGLYLLHFPVKLIMSNILFLKNGKGEVGLHTCFTYSHNALEKSSSGSPIMASLFVYFASNYCFLYCAC